MGNKKQAVKDKEHRGRDAAKQRRFNKAVDRQVKFQIERAGIKTTIEGERKTMAAGITAFLIGLLLVITLLAYGLGVVLYRYEGGIEMNETGQDAKSR